MGGIFLSFSPKEGGEKLFAFIKKRWGKGGQLYSLRKG
jgi:hypothetical protein